MKKMKVALVVNRILPDTDTNLTEILKLANEASDTGADLILFPEAALTGLINNDIPSHDLPLGQVIPGPVTEVLSQLTRKRGFWLAIGLLERDGDKLYDSAILMTPEGRIGLKYRRIQPQWHGKEADPSVYCQGTKLSKLETPFGTFAFMICGDLFDDNIIKQLRDIKPDWLFVPFSRCFNDGSYNQERWDREEKNEYIKQVKTVGVTTLMTNYIADKEMLGGAFGGAMIVLDNGTVIDSFPLGKVGMLLVNL